MIRYVFRRLASHISRPMSRIVSCEVANYLVAVMGQYAIIERREATRFSRVSRDSSGGNGEAGGLPQPLWTP